MLDFLWDIPAVIRAATGRGVSVEPKDLGELTVSTLRGEEGFQAKEVRKLVRYLEGQPPFDVVVIPTSLLIGLAAPLKRALRRPVVCTLQGEDLFLDGLAPRRTARSRSASSARHAPRVDALRRHERLLRGLHGRLPRPARGTGSTPCPSASTWTVTSPRRAPREGPFTLGYFARVAPEEGPPPPGRGVPDPARRSWASRRRGSRPRATWPPSTAATSPGSRTTLRGGGLHGEFRYHGTVDRAGKIAFLRRIDVLSVPSPYAEPKGLYLLEAMANGVPWVQPRHGAFPEMLEKTGGGLLFEPGERPRPRRADPAPGRATASRRRAGPPRRPRACGEHYTAARMAERTLEVFRAVTDTRRRDRPPALATA